MYKQRANLQYAMSRRFYYKKAIFQRLKKGPALKAGLKRSMNVPCSEEKTFYRAINELEGIGAVTKDKTTGMLYAHGHEPPEEVQVTVRTENLEITIPAKKEQATKIIKNAELTKHNKKAKIALKETGLLEKTE